MLKKANAELAGSCWPDGNGAGENRTADTVIFSHVLYQLSPRHGRSRWQKRHPTTDSNAGWGRGSRLLAVDDEQDFAAAHEVKLAAGQCFDRGRVSRSRRTCSRSRAFSIRSAEIDAASVAPAAGAELPPVRVRRPSR